MALKFIFLIAAVNCVYLAAGIPANVDVLKSRFLKKYQDHEVEYKNYRINLQSKFHEILENRTNQIDKERRTVDHYIINARAYMQKVYEDTLAAGKKKNIDASECIATNKKEWEDYEMDVRKCLNSTIDEEEFNRIISEIHKIEDHNIVEQSVVVKCKSPPCLYLHNREEVNRQYNAKRLNDDGQEILSKVTIDIDECLVPSEEWQIFIDESEDTMGFIAKCTQGKATEETRSPVDVVSTEKPKMTAQP